MSDQDLLEREQDTEAADEGASVEPQNPETAELQNLYSSSDDDEPSNEESIPFRKEKNRNRLGGLLKTKKRKRIAAIGVGGGAVTALIAGVGIVSFLGTFRLDHILQNIDVKTFSRYNASLDGRSNAYIKSYIRIRMMEYANAGKDHLGDADGNLYFRANRVQTGDPIEDWYRSIRTSTFETDVLNKNGIFFTSQVTPDGKINPVIMKFKDDPIDLSRDPQVTATMNKIQNDLTGGKTANLAALSQHMNELGPEMDQFLDREVFNSPKQARREIKNVVNDNTKFFQFFKRRHLRKSIGNMIGVRDWRFFETTRDKYLAKKQTIQQKIVSKTFPGEGELSSFLRCIFVGSCNTGNDPVNPDNTPTPLDDSPGGNVDEQSPGKDEKGNLEPDQNLGGDELADSIEKELNEEVAQETEILAEQGTAKEGKTITSRIVKNIVSKYVGEEASNSVPENPLTYWSLLQKLAKFDKLVKSHKLSKMVKKARLAQYLAIYAMYATARDQAKTGELSSEEYGAMAKTTDDFNVSEAWQEHITTPEVSSSGTVFAAAATETPPNPNISKADYCNSTHVKQKGDYAWFCDDQKPNSGGRADSLENAYNNSVGYIVSPIASTVNAVNSTPFGKFANWVTGFVNGVVGKISDVTLTPILNALGITDKISGVVTWAMQKFLEFAGVVPIFTGDQPGVANFLTAGSAGTAEGATRISGGVASTPATLGYSNQLAANYEKDQRANESLYDRYASLSNPTSLFSTTLYNASNTNVASAAQGLLNSIGNIPVLFGKLFSGRTFAATTDTSAAATAEWAGVDTYDIPQQCQELDPLDPNYLDLATNAAQVTGDNSLKGSNLGWATVRDSTQFWTAVYNKIPGDQDTKEATAQKIYNCALLDRQVQGSLGGLYGYADDGGL